jgi:hypothetical protein
MRPGTTAHTQEWGNWNCLVQVDRRLLKYMKLDYTSSDSEVIVLVDASERKERRSKNLETKATRGLPGYLSCTRVVIEDAVRCTKTTGEGGLYRKARH